MDPVLNLVAQAVLTAIQMGVPKQEVLDEAARFDAEGKGAKEFSDHLANMRKGSETQAQADIDAARK